MSRPWAWLLGLSLALGAGLAWQHACQGPARPRLREGRRPNVILVVIDTLRGDLVSGLAGESAEMPFTRELARRGVLFTDVTAPAPWTVPSLTSLLTGMEPRDHGVVRMVPVPRLPAGVGTWAQAFGRAGYASAAYVGGPWALHGSDGLLRGFDTAANGFGLDQAPRQLEGWRRSLRPGVPSFLLLHTFEAHEPYGEENNRHRPGPTVATPGFPARAQREPWEWTRTFFLSRADRMAMEEAHGNGYHDVVVRYMWSGYRAEPRPELAAELRRAYVGGARWVDGLLRTLVTWLEAERLLDDTVLVVASDHGEAFGEHDTLAHGRILHQEVLHVPLLIVGPAPWSGGKVVREHVSLMDLMPTVAELAGVTPPAGSVGTSLAPLVGERPAGRAAHSFELLNFEVTRVDQEVQLRSARTGRYAVVLEWDVRRSTLRARAYDRLTDRAEQHDLAEGRGTLAGLALDEEVRRSVVVLRDELLADGMPPALGTACDR